MAKTPGRKANIYASTTSTAIGNKIASVQNLQFSVSEDLIDVTNHDSSGWNQTISGGRRTGEFTADGFEPSTHVAVKEVRDALTGASSVFISVPLTTSTASPKWTGWARISGLRYDAPENGALVHGISGQFSGAITYTS